MEFANFFVAFIGLIVGVMYTQEKGETDTSVMLKAMFMITSLTLLTGSFFITSTTDLTQVGLAFGLCDVFALALIFGVWDFVMKLFGR